jgi:hypothetical protein
MAPGDQNATLEVEQVEPARPRIPRIAELIGDMPGEPFLATPAKPKKVFPTLTREEADRIWPVFEEAKRQFSHLLRGRRLDGKLSRELIAEFEFEGAAKAVRAAKDGRLTPAFMSTAMKRELSRYWRTPEGRRRIESVDADPDRFEEALGIAGDQERLAGEEVEAPPASITEGKLKFFLRQPSLVKRRIYYAVKGKDASARRVGRLFRHPGNRSYTTREINRVVHTVQADLEFTSKTGKYRDREIKKALKKSVPDDTHREALYLHLCRGMSTRHLATKYGLSNVAVHKWITKGRERLTAYLRQNNRLDLLETI